MIAIAFEPGAAEPEGAMATAGAGRAPRAAYIATAAAAATPTIAIVRGPRWVARGGLLLGSVVGSSVTGMTGRGISRGTCGVSIGGAGSVFAEAAIWKAAQLRCELTAMPSRAIATDSIASKRCERAFASVFMRAASTIDGSAGSSLDGGSGALLRMARTSWKPPTPFGQGNCPVRSSYVVTPHANWSALPSTGSPRSCSGDRYQGVPMIVPCIDCVIDCVR